MVVSRVTSTSQVKTFSNKNTNEMSPENNLRFKRVKMGSDLKNCKSKSCNLMLFVSSRVLLVIDILFSDVFLE
jgi:hypothetical protein